MRPMLYWFIVVCPAPFEHALQTYANLGGDLRLARAQDYLGKDFKNENNYSLMTQCVVNMCHLGGFTCCLLF